MKFSQSKILYANFWHAKISNFQFNMEVTDK